MTNIRRALEAAAAVGGDPVYVEDVFSTDLWAGDATSQEIVNGIDLSGEGGLVWGKCRTAAYSHILIDTVRGGNLALHSNATSTEYDNATMITAFNSDGYDIGSYAGLNDITEDFVSWTFREAPGFFDVVTYTGTGAAQTIAHNLGSVPGCIICKDLATANWIVYHVGSNATAPEDYHLKLDGTNAAAFDGDIWNGTLPTSTEFSVKTGPNTSAHDYIAYVFANDAQEFGADSDESIIKCGSYTSPASGWLEVSLGWEVQYLITKNISAAGSWYIFDVMREMSETNDKYVRANTTGIETAIGSSYFAPTADGFKVLAGWESSGDEICYIAIRRPMKVPEAGTEVFNAIARTGTAAEVTVTGAGFAPDLFIGMLRTPAGYWNCLFDRKRGRNERLVPVDSGAESTITTMVIGFDAMDGVILGTDGGGAVNELGKSYIQWLFKRAPEFMEVVAYTGTGGGAGTGQTLAHNLAVVPEMMILRRRDAGANWTVYQQYSNASPEDYGFELNENGAASYNVNYWNRTAPTSTQFTAGNNINASAGTYIAYLFATLDGVSKVGSYTADATLTTIDCGFSAGARFILIKRNDAAGEWYVYDSVRGIVAGDDPYLLINDTDAEVTNTDYIDPDNSGFQITAAGSSTINVNTGEYIFLAIA